MPHEKKERQDVDSHITASLQNVPLPLLKLIILHLFDSPLASVGFGLPVPKQIAKIVIRNLMLVNRQIYQMTSNVLGLGALDYTAIIPAKNPFTSLLDGSQIHDTVMLSRFECLRAEWISNQVATHALYVALPSAADAFIRRAVEAMTRASTLPLVNEMTGLQSELNRLMGAAHVGGKGYMFFGKPALSPAEAKRQLDEKGPQLKQSIARLQADIDAGSSPRHFPAMARVFPLIARLQCLCRSVGNAADSRVMLRIDLPWAEVCQNMDAFVERGHRCRVTRELSPGCLQNGHGNLPLFLDLLIGADSEQCTLRHGLGAPPGAASQGQRGSDESADPPAPGVEDEWNDQLGLSALNERWDLYRELDGDDESCDGEGGSSGDEDDRPKGEGSQASKRDGDVPEQPRYDDEARHEHSQKTALDDPLFEYGVETFRPRDDDRWPHFSPRYCMNVRQLRRLMVVVGLGPLKDVDLFCDFLFLLCGFDFNELTNRWDGVISARYKPAGE
ncbi:hypothetical protein PAPYR_738 [Paratrimastix pyriformis]|uniref:Uncharacterized protein n=1 Tax=Paratrimastix pyriformis TaxID=342808 RepID=A0ABQ8UZC0_9EUKA|nr:hypothetical protein PAPYR_738 [Paratrimastix pyriformis]